MLALPEVNEQFSFFFKDFQYPSGSIKCINSQVYTAAVTQSRAATQHSTLPRRNIITRHSIVVTQRSTGTQHSTTIMLNTTILQLSIRPAFTALLITQVSRTLLSTTSIQTTINRITEAVARILVSTSFSYFEF